MQKPVMVTIEYTGDGTSAYGVAWANGDTLEVNSGVAATIVRQSEGFRIVDDVTTKDVEDDEQWQTT